METIGYILIVLGSIYSIMTLITIYAGYKVRSQDYEYMRNYEQEAFNQQANKVWKMVVLSAIVLGMGIALVKGVFTSF